MPSAAAGKASTQPAADLRRRPVLGELAGHRPAQSGVHREPAWLDPSSPHIRLVVREPWLIAPVTLSVPSQFTVDRLMRLADPRRDLLDRFAGHPHSAP